MNEMMIAEMFNILGFHLTEPLNDRKKAAIMNKTSLKTFIDFDPQMYTRFKSKEQLTKEKETIPSSLLDEEKLTPCEVRILMRAEEELSQTVNFSRLFPCKDGKKYLSCCQEQSYSDILLQAWEIKYGNTSDRGRDLLVSLCLDGVHTRDFVTKKKVNKNSPKKSIIFCS